MVHEIYLRRCRSATISFRRPRAVFSLAGSPVADHAAIRLL